MHTRCVAPLLQRDKILRILRYSTKPAGKPHHTPEGMTLWNPWSNEAPIITVASSGSHDSSSAHRMFHFSQLSHVHTSIKLNALHSMLTL